jgi:hypothetical protein
MMTTKSALVMRLSVCRKRIIDGLEPSTLYARTRRAPRRRKILLLRDTHAATAQFSLDATFLLYSTINKPDGIRGRPSFTRTNIAGIPIRDARSALRNKKMRLAPVVKPAGHEIRPVVNARTVRIRIRVRAAIHVPRAIRVRRRAALVKRRSAGVQALR